MDDVSLFLFATGDNDDDFSNSSVYRNTGSWRKPIRPSGSVFRADNLPSTHNGYSVISAPRPLQRMVCVCLHR